LAHLLTLCLAVSCALWLLVDVQRLKATVHVKENNLHDFLVLSQLVTSPRGQNPEKEIVRLRKLLADRSWEDTFAGLEPRIVTTAAGHRVQLVRRDDGRGAAKKGTRDAVR